MTSASSWIIQRQERGPLPRSDQWRRRPNAALLKNGEVLAIGETISMPSEPYNPSTGSWNATGNTGTAIINPITPLFSNAEVFATVGFQISSRSYSTSKQAINSAELADPSTQAWHHHSFKSALCSCGCCNLGTRVNIAARIFSRCSRRREYQLLIGMPNPIHFAKQLSQGLIVRAIDAHTFDADT